MQHNTVLKQAADVAKMEQMEEAMMVITQRQGAPTLAQPVLPTPTEWIPPARQQYIAPLVEPIPCKQMVDGFGNKWQVCTYCKRMGTHANDDCGLLEKNIGKQEECIKKRKVEKEAEWKDAAVPKGKRGKC